MEEQDSDNDADDSKPDNTDGNIVDNDIATNRTVTLSDEETLTSPSTENRIEISCMLTEEDNNGAESLSCDNIDDTASNENRPGKTRDIFCDPCENDGHNLIAAGYCVDCDEFLCEICNKAHCRPSITRHHVLLDTDKMSTLKKCETGYNTETCKEHFGQGIQHFCKTHEKLCCSSCMENTHADCKSTESLATMLNEYSGDNEVFAAIESFKSITFDAKRTKTQIRANRHAVDMYEDKTLSDISESRSEIEIFFDRLKNTIKDTVHKDTTNLTALERKVDTMLFDLETPEAHIKYLKTKPKDVYHLFVSV
ncbi:E3 ubiquitin-protein ligase TRIM33-like [Mercenaria mercenaria]|uniref:E3 ubiquitin-protein ligase TRIM33-like n=1 Tax=Mercenaria mercenaria TaxID=6596 RepID=UPI00234E58E8|nr:E3 ubiquitin-protein ligase TRIM33-like [Mercenaria mercenaria]